MLNRLQDRLRWPAVRDYIRTSLWIAPVAYMAAAGGLALALTALDHRFSSHLTGWFIYEGQADGARELLSTIATSMLSIATLVFSITILVLQLASSQFSPRVLRTFLQDGVTQRSLGLFLGAFVYALVLSPRVLSATKHTPAFVPGLAVFASFILALVSAVFFVRYIHHMAHAIRAINIIASVGRETYASIQRLYPVQFLQGTTEQMTLPEGAPDLILFNAEQGGVVISVDDRALLELALEDGMVIELLPRVGEYVPRMAPLMRIWGIARQAQLPSTDYIVLALERTPHQDASYGFRQLVDIAERALSPGINDPTTAVQALDQLSDLLRSLCRRCIPGPGRVDQHGRLRLWLPRPDWDDYVALAFDEIGAYGASSIQVLRRASAMLIDLLQIAPESRQPVLRRQLSRFERALDNYRGEAS